MRRSGSAQDGTTSSGTPSAASGATDSAVFYRRAATLLIAAGSRDLTGARAALRQAVAIGHVDAALLEIALTENGSGGVSNWETTRALLDIAAANDPVAQAHRLLLESMDLRAGGTPGAAIPAPVTLLQAPDVRLFERFFTPAEFAHVARTASDLLEPATVTDPRTGRGIPRPIRSSDAAVIGLMREDFVIRALNLRIAAASATDVAQ